MAINFVFVQDQAESVYKLSDARGLKPREVAGWNSVQDRMADVYGKASLVSSVAQMVARVIATCGNQNQRIGHMIFVGHGSTGTFHIGQDVIGMDTINPDPTNKASMNVFNQKRHILPLLKSLHNFFDRPNSMVFLQSCTTANGDGPSFMKALSGVFDVPVYGWTTSIRFTSESVSYDPGRMVVCIKTMCNYGKDPVFNDEVDGRDELPD